MLVYSYAEKKELGAEDGLCSECNEAHIRQWHLSHRDQSVRWARELVNSANFLVLNTETTALDGELIKIAMLRTLLTGVAERKVIVYNASFDRGILER